MRILKTVVSFKLPGRYVPLQTGHNDYSVRSGHSLGYFMIITGSAGPTLFVCKVSQKLGLYPQKMPDTLVDTVVMSDITIPFNFIFTAHVYFQDGGGVKKRKPITTLPGIRHTREVRAFLRNLILLRLEYGGRCKDCR